MKQLTIFLMMIFGFQYFNAQTLFDLDDSFSEDGLLLIDCGAGLVSSILDMEVMLNDQILLGGECSSSSIGQAVLVLLNSDGTIDVDYGDEGFFKYDYESILPDSRTTLESIIYMENASFLLNKVLEQNGNNHVYLGKVVYDEFETTWGDNGSVDATILPHYSNHNPMEFKNQSNGKLIVIYNSNINPDTTIGPSRIIISRRNSDGSLDFDFSSVTISDMSGNNYGYVGTSIIQRDDGKYAISGYVDKGLDQEPFTCVINEEDGSIYTPFGTSGFYFGEYNTSTYVRSAQLSENGNIVLGGSQWNLNNEVNDQFLIQLSINGIPIESFGVNGLATFNTNVNNTSDDEVNVTRVGNFGDDKIYNGGFTIWFNKSTREIGSKFMLSRFSSEGTIDEDIGNGGYVHTDFGFGTNIANALEIQSDGKILLGGFASDGTKNSMAIARYHNDINTSVRESDSEFADMTIYPNPAHETVSIALTGDIENEYSVNIYNSLGQLIYEAKDILYSKSKSITINTRELSTGLNTVVIRSDESVFTKKLMINR